MYLRSLLRRIAMMVLLTSSGFFCAHAQPASSGPAVEALLQRAEQARMTHGAESTEFFDAVMLLLAKVQGDPAQRAAHKRALYFLLQAIWMDPHPGPALAPQIALGSMEYDDQDYESALVQLHRAQRSIAMLLGSNRPGTAQRWPEVKWRDAVEVMLAECLHRLKRYGEAEAAYSAVIGRMRGSLSSDPNVLARALQNAGVLAWNQRQSGLARERIQASAELTAANPGAKPEDLAERLIAWLLMAYEHPSPESGPGDAKRAIELARAADIQLRLPVEYARLLQHAVAVCMTAGDLGAARSLLPSGSVPSATTDFGASGVHLAMVLRDAELAAQLGDESQFFSTWADIKRQALALPADQQRIFAIAARNMAWESVAPAFIARVEEFDRSWRSRRITELASSLLQNQLPLEHPLNRVTRFQEAFWQYLSHDLAVARAMIENLLSHDAGTLEDAVLRGFALQLLSMVHADAGNEDAAILLSKEALNAIHALPLVIPSTAGEGTTGYLDVPSLADLGRGWTYKWLAHLLISSGRLVEAQQLLLMLRENELAENLRSGGIHQPRDGKATLTGLEQKRFQAFHRIREQQAALAVERQELLVREAGGTLDAVGRRRLQEIARLEANEIKPALSRFLQGLDVAMSATADATVVQASGSVKLEATRIQRDIDQWARDAPKAHAVGLQYLVERNTLSVILTVPGLSPIARQVPVARADLYNAIYEARALLRTPLSSVDRLRPALQKLYTLLIKPIEMDLRQLGARTLLLSLDDRIRQLPFAALVTEDGRYLIEDFAVALYNEATAGAAAQPASRNWHVAAMGLSKAVGGLPALKSVPTELQQVVRSSRSGGRTFLDGQFTLASLDGVMARKLAPAFNVLHLASHFVLRPGDAGRSTLYLGDGTSISLADMARRPLDFRGFELVVYSACDSGIAGGRDADGMELEGLSALTRRQGAASVLGTLWKVSDGSVAKAMALFYGRIKPSKDSLADALRQTQLVMLRSDLATEPDHRHPFHWAPFVLIGSWR